MLFRSGLLTVLLYLAIPSDVTVNGFVVFTDFLKMLAEVFNMEVTANGGLIGALMFGLISSLVSRSGTLVVMITLSLISVYLLIEPAVLVSIKNKISVKIPVSKPEEMPMPSTRTMSDAVADQKPKKTIFINSDEVVAPPKTVSKTEHKMIEEVKTSSAATVVGITN